MAAHYIWGSGFPLRPLRHTFSSQPPRVSTMPASETFFSLLNAAIEALNLANEISGPTPAKAVFGTASALLIMIRVCSPTLQ